MKSRRRRIRSFLLVLVLLTLTSQLVFAEDGIIFRKNVSKTPDQETERANINHMSFYVPAQAASGELLSSIDYIYGEDQNPTYTTTVDFPYVKPLVAVYIDALPEEHEEEEGIYSILSGGAGIGAHDAYASVSLDDGATWKSTNLSLSADLSSFTLADGTPFPGDAHNMTFAIAGDKVLVGWISRYCDGGLPMYTKTATQTTWLSDTFGLDPIYLTDLFGVAGSQKSVDYTLQGYPEVGEIPYSCVWSARGVLLPQEEQVITDTMDITSTALTYDIVWTKAERLTSGRRDANRLEMNGDSAAGFMMTWQEDPEGLRPGQGLGPGEGWSGAVVNGQTDLWYSYISMENFDEVWFNDALTDTVSIAEYEGDTTAKVAVPMAMPIRLTDNAMCKVGGQNPLPYCFINFENVDEDGDLILPEELPIAPDPDGNSTFCASTVEWTPPGGSDGTTTTIDLCVAKDGRVMQGRVGASRPRVNVQPFASETIGVYDSAWVIMGAEESKALGDGAPETTGGGQPIEEDPEDMGKNMLYYSFDMLNPSFVMQGGMLNQPAKCTPFDATQVVTDTLGIVTDRCPAGVGAFYPTLTDEWGNEFYETEISRRFSHMSQASHQIGDAGISSVLIVKQGIINQGGPADIFLRMTKVPDDVVWTSCDLDKDGVSDERCLPVGYNPYAYENLVCDTWIYTGTVMATITTTVGSQITLEQPENPRYLQGLCLSDMVNLSGTSIESCTVKDSVTGITQTLEADACAAAFPWEAVETGEFPKVTEWSQSGPNFGETITDTLLTNFDDQSWENPFDVAKGHRGFIDGDFIMMLYAWSPNWKANSVGNDHYNLYIRRSFDGGKTWTTTPANDDYLCIDEDGNTVQCDGTNTCENYGATQDTRVQVCTDYVAGEFEQARNVSQLIGNKVTILDPRYTPTGGIKMLPIKDKFDVNGDGLDAPIYDDDMERDRSKYFVVYETGDNTTVAEGEAVPMDLFYSRATNWGDDYALIPYIQTDENDVVTETLGFDWLEHDREDLSGEAANTCNPAGTFYYAIWNQWKEDAEENVSDSDAIFRRVMYLSDTAEVQALPTASILYLSATTVEQLAGDELTIIGSARDYNAGGIVAYKWTSDIDGVVGNEKTLKVPAAALSRGKHTFTFSALDGEGHWSSGVTTTVNVVEQIYRVMLPIVMRSK